MSEPGSITQLIDGLRAGESLAILKMWERFFQQLVTMARARLQLTSRAAADEEDVALSAFDSFCRAAREGRFPRLEDRDDLWRVLFLIAKRKVFDLIKYNLQEKRDERKEQPLGGNGSPGADRAGPDPDPAFVAEVADQCRRLLDLLPDDDFRLLAVRKMEGHTNEECAVLLRCSRATIERDLGTIRGLWKNALE